jgi:hypothetical protein
VQNFALVNFVETGSMAHPASYPVGNEGSFPWGEVAGGEADVSPPFSSKVKNEGAIPPLPHTRIYLWHSAKPIKRRDFSPITISNGIVGDYTTNTRTADVMHFIDSHSKYTT